MAGAGRRGAVIGKDVHDYFEGVRGLPLFRGLTRREAQIVGRNATKVRLPPGTVLCKEDDRGRSFLVIVDGSALTAH